MKQIIKNYSFNAAAKTITLADFTAVALDRLLLITNVSANKIIYQFNNPRLGATASGNTFTLFFDTGAMHNADKLQVVYDCATGDPLYDAVAASTATIQGNIAAGSADSGNPVKIGAVYHAAPPTFADGQRGDLQ